MKWPCDNVANCPPCDQNPVRNLTVADGDHLTCLQSAYTAPTPRINDPPGTVHCQDWCFWTVNPTSPEDCENDAWICARRAADQCAGQSYLNNEQTCTKTCQDGTVVTRTVLEGLFAGSNQAEADAKAMGWACAQVDSAMAWACVPTRRHFNSSQCCTVTCADLTQQTYCVAGGLYQAATQAEADALAQAAACDTAQSNCPPVKDQIWNTQQECTVACGDGSTQTYVVPEHTVTGATQADADLLAHNFACAMADLQCKNALVPNTEQSCTVTCPDLSTVTYTVPAGIFYAIDQRSADILAHNYACHEAELYCPGHPIRYRNDAQTCCANCQDGNPFCFTVPANVVSASTKAEANAIAYSAACSSAVRFKMCLSNIADYICSNTAITETIEVTGGYIDSVNTFTIISGAVPTGMSFAVDPTDGHRALIKGTPTTPGAYSFTVRCTVPSSGLYVDKAYTLHVMGIDNASPLPSATVGTAYSVTLRDTIGSGHYDWNISAGSLPPGLNLGLSTGIISGTPTTDGSYNFTVAVTDHGHDDEICTKAFTMTVNAGGWIDVPLRLYHGIDNFAVGNWLYGVNYRFAPTLEYQSRLWVFKGSGINGPYSDTGLSVSLPVGVGIELGLYIKPVTETSPLSNTPPSGPPAYFPLTIDSHTRLLGYDTRAEDGIFNIVYDNAFFEAAALPDYCPGEAYSASVGIWNSGLAGVFSLISGSLPMGLTMDGAGLISGTPLSDEGQRNFIVQVDDGVNPPEACPFTMFSCSQRFNVSGTLGFPSRILRGNGTYGPLTLCADYTSLHNIAVSGTYVDNQHNGFVYPITDSWIWNDGSGVYYQMPTPPLTDDTHSYQMTLEAAIFPDPHAGQWAFAQYQGLTIRIPLVDASTPDEIAKLSSPSAFDGNFQFDSWNGGFPTPVTGASTYMDFFLYSDFVPSGPVGTYAMNIASAREVFSSLGPGTTTHMLSTCGNITVT